METVGEFKYFSTRNNDFTNRSHKGKVIVEDNKKDDVEEQKDGVENKDNPVKDEVQGKTCKHVCNL